MRISLFIDNYFNCLSVFFFNISKGGAPHYQLLAIDPIIVVVPSLDEPHLYY